MPYLFDQEIEAAITNAYKPTEAANLKTNCETVTMALRIAHPGAYPANDPTAAALVASMGSKSRRDRGRIPAHHPHAIDYVGSWSMLSNNAQTIHGKVAGELANAVQLGLDIRKPEVIGAMYQLAVNVWSSIGDYTGYAQDEGKR